MKILFVSHNHPEIRPGGAEGYALEVYEGMREAGEFEPVLLARSGPRSRSGRGTTRDAPSRS